MKTIILLAALTLCLLVSFGVASPANSAGYYYIGIDAVGINLDVIPSATKDHHSTSEDSPLYSPLYGANFHFGVRLGNIGSELGYTATLQPHKHRSENSVLIKAGLLSYKAHTASLSFDFLGYVPLTKAKTLEFIGVLGFAHTLQTPPEESDLKSGQKLKRKFRARLGGGLQYALAETLHIRLMIKWQGVDFSSNPENTMITSLGFHYNF